jgi:hypothetical protein
VDSRLDPATPGIDGRRVIAAFDATRPAWHDIPHPIGDPDDDEGLPGDDEDDEEEDEDEEPLQL